MSEKRINEDPRVTDTIVFELETPDSEGCFSENPYKIDKISIYFVERDFLSTNHGEYERVTYNEALLDKVRAADAKSCEDPTEANIDNANRLREELEATAQRNSYYYKDAVIVHSLGSSSNPAWLSTDTENSLLELMEEDDTALVGKFQYEWDPSGKVREGDYFICWTWTPQPAGDSMSNHQQFTLFGDPRAVSSTPAHITPDDKYEILLERYLPELYKTTLTDGDITPETTERFNNAIAKGFTYIENSSNQLIDLYDANSLHESMLSYLSNLFNLRLKSSDPTLWRRQIKEAMMLFKKKGTVAGLEMAFSQAGMTLNKVTRLWQVVSPYTNVESFLVASEPSFLLTKSIITPIDADNFSLSIRRSGESTYSSLSSDCVEFSSVDYETGSLMTWVGNELATPVQLYSGDTIKVLYQHSDIPTSKQSVEDYIRSLPLSDQREETAQDYPPKNWNVKLIEEDDPLFDVVLSVRNPFYSPVTFGKVRTLFPYSENIYNMEEYNGSTRDSIDPCTIDKNFLDRCSGGISSKFNIDISVEDISDDRVSEIRDILREYTPFHAVVHSINFQGEVNEYVSPPVEEIEILVRFSHVDFVISGNANPFFHRVMEDGMSSWQVTRDQLAAETTVVSSQSGTAYNTHISLITPQVSLINLGVIPGSHVLEILAPSANSGEYMIGDISGETASVVTNVTEPLDETEFTFRLSNITYETAVAKIYQDNIFAFSDASQSFSELSIVTQWDAEDGWKILISDYSATPYDILDITNGVLRLDDPDRTLPSADVSSVDYTILDSDDEEILSGTTGELNVTDRGRVDINDPHMLSISQIANIGYYVRYDESEYLISGLTDDGFYIDGYTDGDAIGVSIEVRKRLVSQDTGFFSYDGLKLTTASDHESGLEIANGANPPTELLVENSRFKENFLVRIDDNYYRISEIDGNTVTLSGLPANWYTLDAGGTLVTYDILWFEKDEVETKFMVFDQIDRQGHDPVVKEVESSVTSDVAISALMMPTGSNVLDNTSQEEGVTFSIEYRNGETRDGELGV